MVPMTGLCDDDISLTEALSKEIRSFHSITWGLESAKTKTEIEKIPYHRNTILFISGPDK